MRSYEETLSRWQATKDSGDSVARLQRAVRENGSSSPCLSGCRSVCWKTFLLSRDASLAGLPQILRSGRLSYGRERERLLRFIEHPETLRQVTIDPLTDDPESPWNTVRQDEVVRDEIRQDVQRLPDDANYHDDRIQSMILDILFVYCKINPNRGGYRQGMHELLAPIVHVVEQDALDRARVGSGPFSCDQSMLEVLDSEFIEHDAYLLFARLMEHAQLFYEVKEVKDPSATSRSEPGYQEQQSTIVEKSRFIHEVCLFNLDEELASHLINIEILPQIFLIRWIRLLFNREFPFVQSLILWDTLFAVDPSLELIDYICCAMLIRIRRQLLEADYSACLKLLLKYPQPQPPHGPNTFVSDALWLCSNMNSEGGNTLIEKYNLRTPAEGRPQRQHQNAHNHTRSDSSHSRVLGSRSPLPSPSRFIQQQGGMESIFQGAAKSAKGVFERGEKLGINQAVRDAMVEIRRNVQTFNETRHSTRVAQVPREERKATETLAAMERRNRQVASLLDETVVNLKAITISSLDDKTKSLELVETAAAKIQFVQVYLGDSSIEMLGDDNPSAKESMEDPSEASDDRLRKDRPNGQITERETEDQNVEDEETLPQGTSNNEVQDAERIPGTESGDHKPTPLKEDTAIPLDSSDNVSQKQTQASVAESVRPKAPIPSRSTLAQSSFSWMLEPGESVSNQTTPPTSHSSSTKHRKRLSSNASRERNAFLFGEVAANADAKEPSIKDDIFGMEPIARSREKPQPQ
ncbi:hypothetical protein HIM_01703 [Hirsutella minnesotensis 3608]|nr:hypothetical protein HIM_01703 [Hirsutella minnesotensis 3608]